MLYLCTAFLHLGLIERRAKGVKRFITPVKGPTCDGELGKT